MPHMKDFLIGKSFTTEMLVGDNNLKFRFRNSDKVDSAKKRFLNPEIILPLEGNDKLNDFIKFLN
jgi:hypothetical protein